MKKNLFIGFIVVLLISVFGAYYLGQSTKTENHAADNNSPAGKKKTFVIAALYNGESFKPAVDGFKDGLVQAVKNEPIELQFNVPEITGDKQEDFNRIAKEVVAAKPDMIMAVSPDMIQAAKMATEGTNIPVVFAFGGDPVDSGFVRTMENSGNNLTGVTWNSWTLSAKRIEILSRIVPSMKTVLVIGKKNTSSQVALNAVEELKKQSTLNIIVELVNTKEELEKLLAGIDPKKIDGISYATDPFIIRYNGLIIQAAIDKKIPYIAQEEGLAEMGALASYGSEFYPAGLQLSRLAKQIIVNGKKPSEVQSQKLSEIKLVLNNDTATRIGVTFPDEIASIANKVILASTSTRAR